MFIEGENSSIFPKIIFHSIKIQITILPIIYPTVYSGADQRKHTNG